jgi:very-short-patch-repair endonuclease
MLPYNRKLTQPSRQLRKNMTAAERFLWSKIRGNQIKGCWFYSQKPVGEYIADFYCPNAKLVIEVDGGQHYSNENMEYDKVRSQHIESLGLKVIRFTNTEVLTNIDGVIEVIIKNMLV